MADDATAEAFAQAGSRIAEIRELRPWVFRAGFRIARGLLKRRSFESVNPPAAPASALGTVDELMELTKVLSHAQRRAFVLRDVLGFSTAEAAELVGSSEVSVRVHLHAARRRLRSLLEEIDS